MRIAVVNGSLSESSSGVALAKQVLTQIELLRPSGVSVVIDWVNLRDLGHGLIDYLYSNVPTSNVRKAYETVEEADLVFAVTPTYQASYSGLFKLFWDMLPDYGVRGKRILLAATGGTGRHGLMIDHALRPLFAYLGALVLPTALFVATQDWGDPGLESEIGIEESLNKRIVRAAHEVWSGMQGKEAAFAATQPKRERNAPTSATEAFPGFVNFETLLNDK